MKKTNAVTEPSIPGRTEVEGRSSSLAVVFPVQF